MISTAKALSPITLIFIFILSTTRSNAQQQTFIIYLREISKKMSFESASIKINNKDASYEELLKIPDSALLKIEVYSKKEAIKFFGKEEGKNGVLLVRLRKGELFHYDSTRPRSHFFIENGDTIYCPSLVVPTINGDTTDKSWTQFLIKNLNSNVPVDNDCPPGIYNVDFSFNVNKDGTVSDVKIFEDPGYGCGGEVRRLMKQSLQWTNALCENKPVSYLQRERVTFVISER